MITERSCLVSLLLLAGCASFPRLTRPPLDPPTEAEWIAAPEGVQLYSSALLPQVEPVGVVYFVLGPEISAAPLYPRLVAALREEGFAVAVLHPRGTGYSPGVRGDIADYDAFLADQKLGLTRLRERFPSAPVFLFGHSAGAALTLHLAATAPTPPAGLVLVNPAFKLNYGKGMGPSFGDYLVYAANAVFRPAALTVDMNSNPASATDPDARAEAEALQRDPLVVRYFSLRFLFAQKKVMDGCAKNAATDVPLLLVEGAKDALVDPRGNGEILAAARTTDKTKLVAAEGRHGPNAVETSVEPLVRWLLARTRRSTVGPVSKAFTSEETPDEPVLGRLVQRAARGQERPMTPEGYKALVAEQQRLQGGRTDPEKHKLALVNATLESVRVVTPPSRDGTVRFGSTVTLEWDDGRTQVVRLVGPDEAEGTNINVESPLAKTLLEQKEGDEVEVTRPRGAATARLVRVE